MQNKSFNAKDIFLINAISFFLLNTDKKNFDKEFAAFSNKAGKLN
jgi:hypothetical protein